MSLTDKSFPEYSFITYIYSYYRNSILHAYIWYGLPHTQALIFAVSYSTIHRNVDHPVYSSSYIHHSKYLFLTTSMNLGTSVSSSLCSQTKLQTRYRLPESYTHPSNAPHSSSGQLTGVSICYVQIKRQNEVPSVVDWKGIHQPFKEGIFTPSRFSIMK